MAVKQSVVIDASQLESIPKGMYTHYRVGAEQFVRPFAQKKGIDFYPGCFFYELTVSVLLREHNNIIVQDSRTKELFGGEYLRELLGIPSGERGRIRFPGTDHYSWFIQSTSYNRKLLWGTSVLYNTTPPKTKAGGVQLRLFQ